MPINHSSSQLLHVLTLRLFKIIDNVGERERESGATLTLGLLLLKQKTCMNQSRLPRRQSSVQGRGDRNSPAQHLEQVATDAKTSFHNDTDKQQILAQRFVTGAAQLIVHLGD